MKNASWMQKLAESALLGNIVCGLMLVTTYGLILALLTIAERL